MTVDHDAASGWTEACRQRAVVLAVRPELDGGRFPVKRVLGESLAIEADIVADGHDALRAVVLDRPLGRGPGAAAWRETELVLGADDTWRATIELPALGRHRYTVEAWIDTFATWRRGLERKLAAGFDVAVELLEGAALVEAACARRPDPVLRQAAGVLRGTGPLAERIAIAIGDTLAGAMARAPDHRRAARHDRELEVSVERPRAACSAWYELFPRSARGDGRHGTLRDVEARLPYVAELGFDVLYLPPIHPIGRAFRKGRDNAPTAGHDDPGSPWAIGGPEGGHTSIHPALGTLADIELLVAAARDRGI